MSSLQYPYLNKDLWIKMKAENTYRINGQLYGNGWPLDEAAIDKEMGISRDAPSSDHPAESSRVDEPDSYGNRGVPVLNPGVRPHPASMNNRNALPGIEVIETGPDYLIYYDPHMDHADGLSSSMHHCPQFPKADRAIPNDNPGDKPQPVTGNDHTPRQLGQEVKNIAPGVFIVRSQRSSQPGSLNNSARHRPDYPRGVRISPHVHSVYFGNGGMVASGADGFPPFVDGLSSRTDRIIYASQYGNPGSRVDSPATRYPSSRHDDSLRGPAYSPISPNYRSASPPSPAYDPASPSFDPMSRACSPTCPTHSPASPTYSPASPVFSPASPAFCGRASPCASLGSPQWSPTSPNAPMDWSPNSPRIGNPTSHISGSPHPWMNEPSPFMLGSPLLLSERQSHPPADKTILPRNTSVNMTPPNHDSTLMKDTNPGPVTSRSAPALKDSLENHSFSLPMRPRQHKKLETSGLRIDTSNHTVKLSTHDEALKPSLVEKPMAGNTVMASSVSKDSPIINRMLNAAPIHQEDLSTHNVFDRAPPKDNNMNPRDRSHNPKSSPEDLGEGLANRGDCEEDLLDGEGYEYIVRN